jgi:cell division protein FtsL
LVLCAAGLVAGIVLVIVVARVLTGQAGFTETDLSKRITEQQRQVEDLQLQIARLGSPQRIYDRAIALGLRPASHVVYLSPSPSPRAATSPAASARATSSTSSSAPERGGR